MARQITPKIAQRVKVSILPSSTATVPVELDYRLLIPGNFSKSEPGALGSIRDRKLVEITNKGGFKNALKKINPKLNLTVKNKLSDDPEAQLEVKLDFQDIKDFHPDEIVKKVEPLQKLLEARERLKNLKVSVLKDPDLKNAIDRILKEGSDSIENLKSKLSTESSPAK